MVVLVLLGVGLLVFATTLANTVIDAADATTTPGTTAPQPTNAQPTAPPTPTEEPDYQNDDYQAAPPPANPPPIPKPSSEAEAKSWLTRNSLYGQVAPRPIRCTLNRVNPQTASPAEMERYLNELSACLMKEWDDVLAQAGFVAIRPRVVVYTGPVQTACGRNASGAAFYCSADQRIYFPTTYYQHSPPELADSPLPMLTVMAHEFGHAIQGRTGILYAQYIVANRLPQDQVFEYSRRLELQADCFAGRFVGSVSQYLGVSADDLNKLKTSWASGGDERQGGNPDHGRSDTQVAWLFAGIDTPGKLAVCNTWTASSDQVR